MVVLRPAYGMERGRRDLPGCLRPAVRRLERRRVATLVHCPAWTDGVGIDGVDGIGAVSEEVADGRELRMRSKGDGGGGGGLGGGQPHASHAIERTPRLVLIDWGLVGSEGNS